MSIHHCSTCYHLNFCYSSRLGTISVNINVSIMNNITYLCIAAINSTKIKHLTEVCIFECASHSHIYQSLSQRRFIISGEFRNFNTTMTIFLICYCIRKITSIYFTHIFLRTFSFSRKNSDK